MVKTVVSLWVTCQAWWLMHAIPAFGRLRQEDCDEFKPSLSCVVSFRPARRPWVAAAALPLTCLFHACCGGGTTLGLWLQGGVVCPAFHICPRVLVPLLCWFSVFFFFHVYGCFACVYDYSSNVFHAQGGQKGASDPPELD